MSEDVKLDVLRNTQAVLSKFIKKPPLTEKLLKKPPFRFLHDIVTSVMRETGFLEGLFTPEEMNPENIKDKDGKILFLEKLIAAVKIASGMNITARPNKIVAGLDVVKTNELLQAIGKALEKKVDSSKAVEHVLNKGKKKLSENDVKQIKDTKNKASKEASKEIITKEEKLLVSPSKENISKEVKKQDSISKENISKDEKKRRLKFEKPNKKKPNPDGEEKVKREADVKRTKPKKDNTVIEEKQKAEEELTQEVDAILKTEPTLSLVKDKSIDFTEKTKQNSITNENTELQLAEDDKDATLGNHNSVVQKTIEITDGEIKRPQSARSGHRKKSSRKQIEPEQQQLLSKILPQNEVKVVQAKPTEQAATPDIEKPDSQFLGGATTQKNVGRETPVPKRPRTATARPASARPGAPRVRDRGEILISEEVRAPPGPVNVIVDTDDPAKEEDDESLLVVEAASENNINEIFETSQEESKVQGHLVAQILETQKELEDTSLPFSEPSVKVDIDWKGGRQREHEAVVNEVEKLRNSIQAITRAANPLGKLIDFLQEDVDSMQSELESWQTSNSQLTVQLHSEQKLTEKSIEPLQLQLNDVEMLILEQMEEINAAKANILRNDQRVHKLIIG